MDTNAYLNDVVRTFKNYKALADKAIAQVANDNDLHTQIDPDSNSLAVIMKHVAGNLRSRFRDFLTTDGEKPDRNRDSEFEMPAPAARADIVKGWDEAWAIALGSIEALTPDDLDRSITIRGEALLVPEALSRSATHTAYHVGQIVYVARHLTSGSWQSLSIPKGQSRQAGGDFKTRGIAR
jgi:hypothetical protein